ncbi:hypothetical protein WJX72_009034 [[Myrmecia] bisecta]|uniref:Ribosomal RNA-processing protein 17 n=1 Tax=[Myrmecia] bisecta TaxID=41462 RepID=A0AAW1Q863_9CHLO
MRRPGTSGRDAKFSEQNALAWGGDGPRPGEGGAVRHVEKRKTKQKGLEVVFDPDKHRDYLTGFHKRKLQRRKAALQEQDSKEKKQRLQDRAERREALRKTLQLDKYETASEASEDESKPAAPSAAEPAADVTVYDNDVWTTTVTTEPLAMHSESEPEGNDSDPGDQPVQALKPNPGPPQKPPQQTKAKAAIMKKLLEKKKKRKKKGKSHAASREEMGGGKGDKKGRKGSSKTKR